MAVCLVGTRWGRYLGEQLRKVYTGPLFVCGRQPARTRRLANALGADDALLGWESAVRHPAIDRLILAIPAHLHGNVACSALTEGKHVLVEKPFATSIADCDLLIRAAQSAGVVLAVGENIPFRPVICEAKRLLPQIGEPRLFFGTALHSATGQNDLSVGILLDFSVHYVRAVRELYGEPDRVYASRAMSSVGDGHADDNVTMVLSSRAGWQATLAFSWQASAGRCPEFVAAGTRGAIKIWPESESVDLYPLEPTRLERAVGRIRPTWLRQWFEHPELKRQRFKLPVPDRMGYQAELRHFLELVRLGQPDVLSAVEARRDLEVVMAAKSSLACEAPVECRAESHLQVA
jgi:predicted dehydrogenase